MNIHNLHMDFAPTRGVLVTTSRKAVIEHNLFERMFMSAIFIADDAESWYESGSVKDITTRSKDLR